jgi:DNA (cytosine-5)-methyltransferase 1
MKPYAYFVKSKRAQSSTDHETWRTTGPIPTLNVFDVGDSRATTLIHHDGKVRRLTPVETERLQGFPDNHTASCTSSQRYKQMGNTVTVPIIIQIFENLKASI